MAALHGFADLCRDSGVDAGSLLRRVGLGGVDPAAQDLWVSASAVAELLELSASACGREDFGLRLSESRRLSNLGPISLLVRELPDVRSVIDLLIRYERMYNQALRVSLVEAGDGIATVHVGLDFAGDVRCRQAVELAVGAYQHVLRGFLGAQWRPVSVCFTHAAPADLRTYRRVFGLKPQFGASLNGIVFRADVLGTPLTSADEVLRGYAREYVESLHVVAEQTDADRVRKIIEVLLPTGRCSVEQVARTLGFDRRTVHRRLARTGDSFSSLLEAARVEAAKRFVPDPGRSLTEISELLGFASVGAFSRWFRGEFGTSPREWRSTTT
ncbi:AraC family transcriptional regulator [Actinospica durhamensis]|uniref:AraC family transcriptional regulator n=1 Tax=Actinospica durhamensis TaxID=1508375 RepID=A0A941IN54_9ACTN|nr:AraC family transcriptional regulator [Actinospica durhamensis]MBR7835020.1 AraC family transcriptional regulator [Actinospica durhamensis]